jgi:hypothetical protein
VKTLLKIVIAFAIVFAAFIFIFQQWFFPHPNPRNVFEHLVTKPIPKSVGPIEEGHSIRLDSTFWALHFQISKVDLQTILTAQHFIPIDENEKFKRWDRSSASDVKISKEQYLNRWKQNISNTAKLNVNFAITWQIFNLKEGNGTKYFLFDTNSTDAVFVAAAH